MAKGSTSQLAERLIMCTEKPNYDKLIEKSPTESDIYNQGSIKKSS